MAGSCESLTDRIRSSAIAPAMDVDVARSLWRAVARPDTAAGVQGHSRELEDWAARLAARSSPALADYVLAAASRAAGRSLVDADAVQRARLLGRYTRALQDRCLADASEAGISLVALKGYALAHQLYPDPDVRLAADLDVLLRPEACGALLDHLGRRGYRFQPLPQRAWGFISDASYAPLVSPDGGVNVDVHLRPDCYPAHLGLGTEAVFAAARPVPDGPEGVLVPSLEHDFLLLASNAAKDKFAAPAVKKVLDALVLLRDRPALDWEEIATRVRRGRLGKPMAVFLHLLDELGADLSAVPSHLRGGPGPLAAAEVRRMVEDWLRLFPHPLGTLATLRREILLSAEPGVAVHNNALRLRGLYTRRDGVPREWRDALGPGPASDRRSGAPGGQAA